MADFCDNCNETCDLAMGGFDCVLTARCRTCSTDTVRFKNQSIAFNSSLIVILSLTCR